MADPNRSGSSPLDLACFGLGADELQQLRTLQAGTSPSATSGGAAPLAVHPGPAPSRACNDVHGQLEGAPIALNQAPGTKSRKRVRVVDGRGHGDAPVEEDFDPAPFVPTNRCRGPGGSARVPRVIAGAAEPSGAVQNSNVLSQRGGGRGRGPGRGRGRRGGAERARLLQLAASADPLVRHVRPRLDQQRDMDDVEDAVDDGDDDDASLSSDDEDPDAENAEDERRAEKEPPCFIRLVRGLGLGFRV
jgi:hypothetical protein